MDYKVICVDNFDREIKADILICEHCSKYMGERIAKLLNEDQTRDSPNFYKSVQANYVLYEPEF